MSAKTVDPPPAKRKKALKALRGVPGALVGGATILGTVAAFGAWLSPIESEPPAAKPTPAGGSPTSELKTPPQDSRYRSGMISNRAHGYVLTLSRDNQTNQPYTFDGAALIVTVPYGSQERQIWMLKGGEESMLLWTKAVPDKVVEMAADGSKEAQIHTEGGGRPQRWQYRHVKDGWVTLSNVANNGCLTSNGKDDRVTVTPCELDNPSQLWSLH